FSISMLYRFLKLWHRYFLLIISQINDIVAKVIKRKSNKKRNLILIGSAVLIFGFLGYLSLTKKRALNVKTSEVLIKEVKLKYFEDFIVFQKKLEPKHSMLKNGNEGSSVQEIYIENRSMAKIGQAFARLYNPNS